MKKIIFAAIGMLFTGAWCYSQVLIGTPLSFGTSSPAPQAVLELASSNQGLLLPRVTDTNAITGGGLAGLIVYATNDNKLYMHDGTAWMPACYCNSNGNGGGGSTASINSFTNCPGTVSGTFTQGVAGTGTLTLQYSGGNGGAYVAMNVASTGVTGLTAQLAAGTLANGNGSLVFKITGTPAGSGTASFPVTLGGRTCTMSIPVKTAGAGSIGSFTNCPGTANGTFTQGVAGTGTLTLQYSGGNGGTYTAMTLPSAGVTGLTAQLSAGALGIGNGSLVFTISGTPAGSGTASFPIILGGQFCVISVTVIAAALPVVTNVTLIGSFAGYKNNVTSYPIIRPGSPLTCQYTYSGPPQGATIYTWYMTNKIWYPGGGSDGATGETVLLSGSGPAYSRYTPNSSQRLHFIRCVVTPVTASGVSGTPVSTNNWAYVYQ